MEAVVSGLVTDSLARAASILGDFSDGIALAVGIGVAGSLLMLVRGFVSR